MGSTFSKEGAAQQIEGVDIMEMVGSLACGVAGEGIGGAPAGDMQPCRALAMWMTGVYKGKTRECCEPRLNCAHLRLCATVLHAVKSGAASARRAGSARGGALRRVCNE